MRLHLGCCFWCLCVLLAKDYANEDNDGSDDDDDDDDNDDDNDDDDER